MPQSSNEQFKVGHYPKLRNFSEMLWAIGLLVLAYLLLYGMVTR